MNGQIETDRIVDSLSGRRPRLLLHACCAPCASSSLEYLTAYFDTDVFFYNPNISPDVEYRHRLAELERFCAAYPFSRRPEVIPGDYRPEDFFLAAKGLEAEPERGARCLMCFRLRLDETGRLAARLGYDYFATTLTLSPLKNPDDINAAGFEAAEKTGAAYLPTDLKKRGRYQRSIELSREYGLYRQSFCGCIYSKGGKSDES